MDYKAISHKTQTFETHAIALDLAGFEVLPVPFKQKGTTIKGWSSILIDEAQITTWLTRSVTAGGGLAIRCGELAAIDIDCYDKDLTEKMLVMVEEVTGLDRSRLVMRVGQEPKLMVVMSTGGKPFSKIDSGRFQGWDDDAKTVHKVEILCKGQYFVAAGIHPDTNKSFRWNLDLNSLTLSNLPVVTREQGFEIVERAKAIFHEEGIDVYMPPKKAGSPSSSVSTSRPVSADSDDDLLTNAKALSSDFTVAEVQDSLNLITGLSHDYDQWCQVGMILHTLGTMHSSVISLDVAFEMFDEWSATSESNKAGDAKAKWRSYTGNKADGLGIGSLFRLAKIARTDLMIARADTLTEMLAKAMTPEEITQDVLVEAKLFVVESKADSMNIEILAGKISDKYRELGAKISVTKVRQELLAALGNGNGIIALPDGRKVTKVEVDAMEGFHWCKEWFYVSALDCYYNTSSLRQLTSKGFNIEFSHVFTPAGCLRAEVLPEQFMSSVYQIESYAKLVCMPDRAPNSETNFRRERVYNTYVPEPLVATKREDWTEQQAMYVTRLKRQFLLCAGGDEREAELFLNWFATCTITPERRVQWFALLTGMEGTGKSLFYDIAGMLLGEQYTTKIGSSELAESRFNGYAEGKLFAVIEELKIAGNNRLNVQNKVKDFSNPTTRIEHKGKGSYVVPNYMKILAVSNYADAVKMTDTDRRWFILWCEFNTEASLAKFLKSDPEHFTYLYDGVQLADMIQPCMSAVKGWFEEVLADPCKEFASAMASQRAPLTQAKEELVEIEADPVIEEIIELIEDALYPLITSVHFSATEFMALIDTGKIKSVKFLPHQSAERGRFASTGLSRILKESPMLFGKSYRFRINGERHTVWFKKPEGASKDQMGEFMKVQSNKLTDTASILDDGFEDFPDEGYLSLAK